MGNVASRIVIGSFYLGTISAIVKNVLVSLKLSSYVWLVLRLVIRLLSLINVSFTNNYLFGCFVNIISFYNFVFRQWCSCKSWTRNSGKWSQFLIGTIKVLDINFIIYKTWVVTDQICLFVCLMVFKATFSNISDISCRPVLLVEKTGGPGEKHYVVHVTQIEIRTHNISGYRHWVHGQL